MQNFFHHIYCVHNSLCYCIFWLIRCTVRLIWILLFLKTGNIFKLICFFFKKLINFFLVFDNSLSYYLTMLNHWTLSWIFRWISLSFFLSILLCWWTCRIRPSIFRFPYIRQITWRLNSFINFILFLKSLIAVPSICFIIFF